MLSFKEDHLKSKAKINMDNKQEKIVLEICINCLPIYLPKETNSETFKDKISTI